MSNITFNCPHCSYTTQLASSTEGMKGNCPSCKAVVTINANAPVNPSVLPQQPIPQQPIPPINQLLLDAQEKLNTKNYNRDNKGVSNESIAIIAKISLAIIGIVLVVFVVKKIGVGFSNMQDQIANSAENIAENIINNAERDSDNSVEDTSTPRVTSDFTIPLISGPKITEVTVQAGEIKITDHEEYGSWCDLHMRCNNGLIIECQFKRNPLNFDFGYDITEPTVNMSYNKLAVFVTARGVIKNYLDGNYN